MGRYVEDPYRTPQVAQAAYELDLLFLAERPQPICCVRGCLERCVHDNPWFCKAHLDGATPVASASVVREAQDAIADMYPG